MAVLQSDSTNVPPGIFFPFSGRTCAGAACDSSSNGGFLSMERKGSLGHVSLTVMVTSIKGHSLNIVHSRNLIKRLLLVSHENGFMNRNYSKTLNNQDLKTVLINAKNVLLILKNSGFASGVWLKAIHIYKKPGAVATEMNKRPVAMRWH